MQDAFTYDGIKVGLTSDHQFEVQYAEGDTHRYPTAKQAEEYIDRRNKAESKGKRVNVKLPVIGEDGSQFNVTGVHLGTGALLGTPRSWKRYHHNGVYPNNPAVVSLVERRVRLREAIQSIDEALVEVELDSSYKEYGDSGWTATAVEHLKANHADRMADAENLAADEDRIEKLLV